MDVQLMGDTTILMISIGIIAAIIAAMVLLVIFTRGKK